MAKKFLTGLNLVVLDADPATGSEGELYFNSSASVAKIYQAGAWSVLGAGGGGTTVSTTEPPSPEIGDSWYKNDTGEFYVYDGTYWVEVNGVISLSEEQVQDYVAPLFEHNNHINITATYDDINNEILLEGVSAVSGSLSNIDSIVYPDYITFDTTPENESEEIGTLSWDSDFETLKLQTNNVTLQIGQEHVIRVKNASGSTAIPNMSVVMFAGSTGDTITVSPAISTASYEPEMLVGITTEEIDADGFGFVTQFGFVNKVDTSDWELGNLLYSDPANPGQLTNIKPSSPSWTFPIAAVTRVHASTGRILVRAIPGLHLHDLVDADISSLLNDQALVYNSSASIWNNAYIVNSLSGTENEVNVSASVGNIAIGLPNDVIISNDLTVGGNLTVSGSVTYINSTEVNIQNAFIFEGATADNYETTLTVIDPTQDRTISLPNSSGTIALTDDLLIYLTEESASVTYITNVSANESFQPLNTNLTEISNVVLDSGFLITDGVGNWSIDTNLYLTENSASENYLTQSSASNIYLSQTSASIAYQPVGSYVLAAEMPTYLDGYLTEVSASSTYLTQSEAGTMYQPLDSDLTSIASLTATGLLKNTAGTWSIDESSYLTTSAASEIYLSQSNAASVYLTTSDASLTYAPLSNPTFTGTVSLPSTTDIGDVSSTEIGYLNGVTSSIQTQIDSKSSSSHNHDGTYQPLDGDLTAISAITSGVGLLKRLSSDTWTIDTSSYITGSSPTISTSILSGTSTFNLINSTATTVNFAGAATSLTIGSNDPVATTTLRTPTILTTSSSLDLFNTVATTLNFAGATTSLTIGGTPTGATSVTLFGNTTGSGYTKTINIGTGGASGSNTEINIGSSISGATGTVSFYPSTVFNGTISVPTPTSSAHAANKSYVDSLASGINIKSEVVYVSQQALDALYVNGTSDSSGGLGVGATLTGNVDGALILDGDEVQTNQRVLIKDQSDQKHNGIYIVTFPGDGDDPFILTRASDFNGASATNGLIKSGDYIFVTSGSVSANDSYVVSQGGTSTNPAGAIKVGTNNIVLAQYSGVPSNISTLGYVTVGTWAATPIDKDYIDVEIARTNNPIFTGHVTVPSPVDDTDAANKEYVDDLIFASLPYLPDIVPLDDMRYEFDGINSRFLPKFEGEKIDINNPLRLLLTINGIIQVVDFPEYVWQSMLPREGFMVDSDGYIAYSEVPPVGSTFDARLMLGPNVNSIKKGYPFKAVDILLGA